MTANTIEHRNISNAKEILPSSDNVVLLKGDLTDLTSVSKAIESIPTSVEFDILINNAGIMSFERSETIDGFESTFQVNLLAPFMIFEKLKKNLTNDCKVINTVSGLHQGKINFKDLQFKKNWSMLRTYRQSKLGLILLTRLLATENPDIKFYSQLLRYEVID